MHSVLRLLLGAAVLATGSAHAQPDPALHAVYDTYAAGFDVARVEVGLGIDDSGYQIRLAYHTTGLVGFFYRGHQINTVSGGWNLERPAPREFYGAGVWRGQNRLTVIDYLHGQPLIRDLLPPQASEREPVPMALQQDSVDTLSALALLIHRVGRTGHCEASVHTFDGRRATEISARTAGLETLPVTSRSSFSGVALRCDFIGQMLAGYRLDDRDPADHRPLQGSAWLSTVMPGAPPVPVRMRFQTRWFGEATMYLTDVANEPPTAMARH